ncbi:MAG: S8 family serine peptidase [Bryobacterales bacterium]|nr:S8 family serine peptidase [Bryobacterales bacterium]
MPGPWRVLLSLLLFSIVAAGQPGGGEYAIVLEEAPLVEQTGGAKGARSAAAEATATRLAATQERFASRLGEQNIRVTGRAHRLANAVFARMTREQAREIAQWSGVKRVEYLPPLKRHLDGALDLVLAREAWSLVGGEENAGNGMRIGILDSGIDHEHPAFQDPSLPMPQGYPRGRPEELPFTSNKIIVARSYVFQLGFDVNPAFTRPDDDTPRDRVGHGTAAAMIAAGRRVQGPAATIVGVAPRAYLGNYKIFGSPGVNDSTFGSVLIEAIEDAFDDGMDIVSLSLGSPALYGPLDQCRNASGALEACDIRAEVVDLAMRSGMAVVVSAGNDGDYGLRFPALNTIHTPGTAPAAITVGATTNRHIYFSSVRVGGDTRRFDALFGNGPKPEPTLTGPLRDVTALEDDGLACAPLGNGTLSGAIALVRRGECGFAEKVRNAQNAGATGVIVYQAQGVEGIFPPRELAETGIPLVLVGHSDGLALRDLSGQVSVTLDPALVRRDAEFDTVAFFSSRGPALGDTSRGEAPIKPEVAAVGTDLYAATQVLDPNGEFYDRTRFTSVQGTSFSAPMVAGAAALVWQQRPDFRAGQVKSAVVNTASSTVREDGAEAPVTAVGAGKLDVNAALSTRGTVEPATLSFGIIGQASLPRSLALTFTNTGPAPARFDFEVSRRENDPAAQLVVTPTNATLGPEQQQTITVRLQGTRPAPGSYSGYLIIRGPSTNLRVPFLYLVGDNIAADAVPVLGDGFRGILNEQGWLMGTKVVDRSGVPVTGVQSRFRSIVGGGRIDFFDPETDVYGIAAAEVTLGPEIGEQQFSAEVGGLTIDFFGRAYQRPAIATGGIVNAASFETGQGLAPGSYITIQGEGLAPALRAASTASLPVSLAGVSVSFDSATTPLSLPGRLHFVSPNQINVQIPWEFEGFNVVLMKVSVGPGGNDSSAVFQIPLSAASPAFFEFTDPDSGRRLIAGLDGNFRLLTEANRARRGQAVQLFANGLGAVTNRPASGEPTPASPFAEVQDPVSVTVGGRPAQVLFSGLAPLNVGLYQVNVVVPQDAPSGLQPVVLTVRGIQSKVASLYVE